MRLGLFGGTFDPPHTGHLIVAQDAALRLGLDRIVFIPAARPPHKQHITVAPAPLRLRMLQLALAHDDRFALDPLELERAGPSYTVDTLRELHRRTPGDWTLLLGADQYAEFETWREPDEVASLASLAVLERAGTPHPGTAAAPSRVVVRVPVTRIDISSTSIRERVAAAQPIRYLVPREVEEFIHEVGLYVRNGTPPAG